MNIDEKYRFKGRNETNELDDVSELPTIGRGRKGTVRQGATPGSGGPLERNFGASPKSKPKRFMEMESTLEPELDLTLKVVLA